MKHFFFTVILLANMFAVIAQQAFIELKDANGLNQGAISVVDIDGDGNADIIFAGKKGTAASTESTAYIYEGHGDGTFSYLTDNSGLAGGYMLNFYWEDFNGDGKLDLYNTGYLTARDKAYIKQYIATDDFCLTEENPFPAKPTRIYGNGSAVADFDNDGLYDYVHVYEAGTISHIVRFQDAENDSVSFKLNITKQDGSTLATQINGAQITLVDFNHDGFIDIFITGHIANPTPGEKYTGLFINNGDRTFTEKKFPNLTAGNQASSLFADTNGDGEWDLIYSCYISATSYPLTYFKNEGGDLIVAKAFDEAYQSSAASSFGVIADVNNDGYYDFVIAGNNNGSPRAKKTAFYIYNPANGNFELNEALTGVIPGVDYSVLSAIDADNDGILDLALMGVDSNAKNLTAIYKNTAFTASNEAPTAPANLQNTITGSKVKLNWGAATDDKTPANSLTYNISLKNKTTGKYVIHPKANIATGKRQVYAHGNAFMAKTKTMTLPDGEYEWSVQAIDAAYAGGQFAAIKTFKIGEGNSIKNAEKTNLQVITGNGIIKVEGEENISGMKLFNITGSCVSTSSNSNQLNYGQASGIYILKIKTGQEEISRKVVL